MRRAQTRTSERDFWSISSELPKETRNYVPKLLAAATLAQRPEHYGFRTPNPDEVIATKTMPIARPLALTKIAEVCGLESGLLWQLNPTLKQGITPPEHLYGKAFEKAYVGYEAKAARGEIKNYKTLSAVNLWRKMLSMLFETGHPWFTFKDPCNLRSPQQHVGVVHSSNLCTEITLNTSADEIAVCNLGSVNLVNHIVDGKLDTAKLIKHFGGDRKVSKMLSEMQMPVSASAVGKWRIRERIPVHHLAALSIIAKAMNQRFDIHEYVVSVGEGVL